MNNVSLFLLVLFYALALDIAFEMLRIGWYLMRSRQLTNAIQKFEQRNPSAATRILFIGDSTGYGTGTSDARYSIVGRLCADFPEAHVENHSSTGAYVSKACRVLQEKVGAPGGEKFDLIIIMLGGMNLVHFTPLWIVRRTLVRAIAYSKQCGRATVIIAPNNAGLVPLYHFPLSRLYQKRARDFSTLYQTIAQEEHIYCVSLFQERPDALSARGLFALDHTHPNDEGYGFWYNQMKGVIVTALKQHHGTITN